MTLLICLLVQAALLGFNLNLLDLWTDELSLQIVLRPIPDVLRIAAADVHPPLYYLLQHYWLELPLGMNSLAQMRLLSVIFLLLTTVALDRLWLRGLPERTRRWFLALWVLSPCVAMYARMGRSYSLQVLTIVVALWWAHRLLEKPTWRRAGWFCLGAVVTLYVHYVPGIALVAGTSVTLLWRRQWRILLVSGAVIAAAYLPWLPVMLHSVLGWSNAGPTYRLTGRPVMEVLLKAGYAAVSFVLGEAVPDAILATGIVLIPAVAWLAWMGGRRARVPGLALAVMAGAAFLGVARWVSYPFTPARLLFLYPFILLLVVTGIEARPRAGTAIAAALALVSAIGLWNYFDRSNYLNKGYAMPFAEIAATIRAGAPRDSALVLCDSHNTDFPALGYYLGPGRPVELIGSDWQAERAEQEAAAAGVRTVWMFRNTHDISGGSNTALEQRLAASWDASRRYYLSFSPLQRAIARRLGVADPPEYFCELVEFRRRDGTVK